MSNLSHPITFALIAASLTIAPLLGGCMSMYSSQTTTKNTNREAGEGDLKSCRRLKEMDVEYTNRLTDKRNQSARYIQRHSAENSQYGKEITDLSAVLVLIDQDLLAFCEGEINREHILADLILNLTNAGRARDALRVYDECARQYPKSPYCVAASAEALHKLGRNVKARAAAEQVIRRDSYDVMMEATISQMRALLALIDSEEQLRAIRKKIEEGR